MKQLQYLDADSSVYFITNYYPTTATGLSLKVKYLGNFEDLEAVISNNCWNPDGIQLYAHPNFDGCYYCNFGEGEEGYVHLNDMYVDAEITLSHTGLTVNGETVQFQGNAVAENPFYINSMLGDFNGNTRFYYIQIYENGVLSADFVPVYDENDDVCFYDNVSNSYLYAAQGTPVAGPLASTINVTSDSSNIAANGGIVRLTVNSETSWTASTSANFATIGTLTGTSATTSTTVTIASNETASGRTCVIDFVNETGDTASVTINQKKLLYQYTFCDKVYNNRTASIDTGIYPDSATTIDIIITNENTGNTGYKAKYVGNSDFFLSTLYSDKDRLNFEYGDGYNSGGFFYTDATSHFILGNTGYTQDGSTGSINMTEFTATGDTIKIGESGNAASFGRCIISKGGEVVADLRPCTFGNNVGFYNVVSETFIGNTGFTAIDVYGNLILGDGDTDIEQINLGSEGVSIIFLGDKPMYANSPFVGLKMSDAELNYNSGSTGSTVVKSSEPWTLTIDSAVTWLSASTLSGPSGKTNVVFTATENNSSNSARTTVVTATSSSFSATCEVKQNIEALYITCTSNEQDLYIDLGTYVDSSSYVEVTGMWKGITQGNTVIGYLAGYDNPDGWRFFNYDTHPYFDWGANRIGNDNFDAYTSGLTFNFKLDNYGIYDNDSGQYIAVGNPVQFTETGLTINVDVGTIWIKSIKIYRNNVLVFNGVGKDDGTHIGIYDIVGQTMYYNQDLTMITQ